MKTSAEGFQPCCDAQLAVGRGEPDRRRRALGPGGIGPEPPGPPARRSGRDVRGHAGDGAGRRRMPQRGGAGPARGARRRRLRGAGPGREQAPRRRPGHLPGHAPHGGEAGDSGGQGPLRAAQVALRGPERLDQGGDGLSALQRPGTGQGAGRAGLGVPGAERQADGPAGGQPDGPATGESGRESPPEWPPRGGMGAIPAPCERMLGAISNVREGAPRIRAGQARALPTRELPRRSLLDEPGKAEAPPKAVVRDNGPDESVSKVLCFWIERSGAAMNFIHAGKPI